MDADVKLVKGAAEVRGPAWGPLREAAEVRESARDSLKGAAAAQGKDSGGRVFEKEADSL